MTVRCGVELGAADGSMVRRCGCFGRIGGIGGEVARHSSTGAKLLSVQLWRFASAALAMAQVSPLGWTACLHGLMTRS